MTRERQSKSMSGQKWRNEKKIDAFSSDKKYLGYYNSYVSSFNKCLTKNVKEKLSHVSSVLP